MTRLFAITPSTVSTDLGAERHGQMSFTVSNTDEAPRHVRFYLVPGDEVEDDWIALGAEPEHELAAGATHEVTVDIDLPAMAEEGKYNFRLDVVSVADPDEDFTEGPVVSFAAPPALPEKKPFPWRLVAATAGLVLLATATTWMLWPGASEPAAATEVAAAPSVAAATTVSPAAENDVSAKARKKDRRRGGKPRNRNRDHEPVPDVSRSEPAAAAPPKEPAVAAPEEPNPSAWTKSLIVFLVLAALGGMGAAMWFFRRRANSKPRAARPASPVRRK